ncbi:MAG: carboxymuconolactone decarboxylase family protein [Burkholderiales bacterium]
MARIPSASRNDFDERERPAYDAFVSQRGSPPSVGPYALLLHMPEVAQRLESLRLCIRGEASLPQRLQELVMITVAREMDCAYIWYAHAAAAREIGVGGDIVDGVREKRPLTGLTPDEQNAVDFARELLRSHKVSQATFDRASASFGQRGTLTLTNLVGCYAMLAYFMNAYALEAPVHPTEPALPA